MPFKFISAFAIVSILCMVYTVRQNQVISSYVPEQKKQYEVGQCFLSDSKTEDWEKPNKVFKVVRSGVEKYIIAWDAEDMGVLEMTQPKWFYEYGYNIVSCPDLLKNYEAK